MDKRVDYITIKHIEDELKSIQFGKLIIHKQNDIIVGMEPCPYKKATDYDI